jgi:lysozyme
MKTGIKGIELIKKFEGCKLTAYKCPAGLMTIGWGNTYYSNGAKVKVGDKITQQQADELLLTLLPKYEKTVNNNIKLALTQNQFDALVSFCWNCGSSNTLFSKVNSNASDLISWWQTHYITGGGKKLKGLVNRRKAESELYQLK